jgi:hypothetical protein
MRLNDRGCPTKTQLRGIEAHSRVSKAQRCNTLIVWPCKLLSTMHFRLANEGVGVPRRSQAAASASCMSYSSIDSLVSAILADTNIPHMGDGQKLERRGNEVCKRARVPQPVSGRRGGVTRACSAFFAHTPLQHPHQLLCPVEIKIDSKTPRALFNFGARGSAFPLGAKKPVLDVFYKPRALGKPPV